MTRQRSLLAAGLLALLPACGHKGDPLPPLRRTPPAPGEFRLAQRGDRIELAATAPGASIDGRAYQAVGLEFLYLTGDGDLERMGKRIEVRARPGERRVETLPLPAPGTVLRAAVQALAGGDEGPRTLTRSLVVQPPLEAPYELVATLADDGIALAWRGVRPKEVPPPPAPARPAGPRAADSSRAAAAVAPPSGAVASETPVPQAPDAVPGQAATSAAPRPTPSVLPPQEAASAAPREPRAETASPGPPRRNGFFVYRRTGGSLEEGHLGTAPLELRRYTDTTAPLGVTVCYVVRAVGSVDPLVESAPSDQVCLERRDITPPDTPTGLSVLPRAEGLDLAWSPSSAEDLAGYRIRRSLANAASEKLVELPPKAMSYRDQAVEKGSRYLYTVAAFDTAGNESAPCEPVEASLP